VAATAALVAALVRETLPQEAGRLRAGLIAGGGYILWLNFMECEGGQAPVFYNLPMAGAALLLLAAIRNPARRLALGAAAMALVGLAIQIKYTVVIEGLFFGLALLWADRHAAGWRRLAHGLAWVTAAVTPTVLALAWYWRLGELDSFVFANFRSIFGRLPDPWSAQALGALMILGILSPLAAVAWFACRRDSDPAEPRSPLRLVQLWLAVAVAAVVMMGAFLNPQYAAPLLPPLLVAGAGAFAGRHGWRRALWLGVPAAIAGQAVLALSAQAKGGRDAAYAMARAAQPPPGGCLYVYDGYPALYLLTHSCLPSRWVFPGHLDTADEASAAAIGIDPLVEEARILRAHPPVIVDDSPAYALGNPQTRALLAAVLARDYHLTFRLRTGRSRYRLVYRLVDGRPNVTR
jgi:hypothetical protein